MKANFYPSNSRGTADYGWLKTKYSFSFSQYYDPSRMNFGALRVLNDDIVEGGAGFGTHPHQNMEIITIVLKGALEHKDSMGNIGVIHNNEVQVMSAGKGIQHSEYNHHPSEEVHLFQIWVIPNEMNVIPRYQQLTFDWNDKINDWQRVVGPSIDKDGLWIHQNAWIHRGKFSEGKEVKYSLKDSKNGVFLMVVDGEVEMGGKKLQKGDAIGMAEFSDLPILALNDADLLAIEVPLYF